MSICIYYDYDYIRSNEMLQINIFKIKFEWFDDAIERLVLLGMTQRIYSIQSLLSLDIDLCICSVLPCIPALPALLPSACSIQTLSPASSAQPARERERERERE